MNDLIKRINESGWADWSFDKLESDYEAVRLYVSYDNTSLCFMCNYYIGYEVVGHWDENIIHSIKVELEGDLIRRSLTTVKRLYGDNPVIPGCPKSVYDKWLQVEIKLIDGLIIKVACKELIVEGD